tara:strand:- start:109 stop:327 length:219 start_codon:yes stop_codon:yes gene_type:complete
MSETKNGITPRWFATVIGLTIWPYFQYARLKQGHQMMIDIHLLQVLCGTVGIILVGEIVMRLNEKQDANQRK